MVQENISCAETNLKRNLHNYFRCFYALLSYLSTSGVVYEVRHPAYFPGGIALG